MNIRLIRNYAHILVVEADNVHIEEDIEERTYPKKEDGKFDFSVPPKRDIKTGALEQFASILEDMIYYREAAFNSSSLIEVLFDKLPEEHKQTVYETIKKLI